MYKDCSVLFPSCAFRSLCLHACVVTSGRVRLRRSPRLCLPWRRCQREPEDSFCWCFASCRALARPYSDIRNERCLLLMVGWCCLAKTFVLPLAEKKKKSVFSDCSAVHMHWLYFVFKSCFLLSFLFLHSKHCSHPQWKHFLLVLEVVFWVQINSPVHELAVCFRSEFSERAWRPPAWKSSEPRLLEKRSLENRSHALS